MKGGGGSHPVVTIIALPSRPYRHLGGQGGTRPWREDEGRRLKIALMPGGGEGIYAAVEIFGGGCVPPSNTVIGPRLLGSGDLK